MSTPTKKLVGVGQDRRFCLCWWVFWLEGDVELEGLGVGGLPGFKGDSFGHELDGTPRLETFILRSVGLR